MGLNRAARGDRDTVGRDGETPSPPARAHPSRRRRPLVLIAEDTADTRDLYTGYFTSRGFVVLTAQDGAAAVRVASEAVPDVMIVDLAMPQFDGITVIRKLKTDPRMRRTRAILLTGYPSHVIERAALDAGVDLFLTKPCLPDTLERHVDTLWRKTRGSRRRSA
jgi:two-component system cell cycle response regulator DivK